MGIHILLAGEEIGPFSETQVRQYMGEGLVSPSDLAMHEGMRDWQSVEALLANLPPAQPAPQAVSPNAIFIDPIPSPSETPEPRSATSADAPITPGPAPSPAGARGTPSPEMTKTRRKVGKIVLQPLAPTDKLPTPPKTGKLPLLVEPLQPTSALPPASGLVAKERTATKPMAKPGSLFLKDIPAKIAEPSKPKATPPPLPIKAKPAPIAVEPPPPPALKPKRKPIAIEPPPVKPEPTPMAVEPRVAASGQNQTDIGRRRTVPRTTG